MSTVVTAETFQETLSERLGPIASGEHSFLYQEHRCVENGIAWPPSCELLVDVDPDHRRDVRVESDGPLNAPGPWGVYIDFEEPAPIPPTEARKWAHAILAAANLAEQMESRRTR